MIRFAGLAVGFAASLGAQSHTARDSAEAELIRQIVIAVVPRPEFAAIHATPLATSLCLRPTETSCVPDSLRTTFQKAVGEFRQRNMDEAQPPAAVLQLTGLQVVATQAVDARNRCAGIRYFRFAAVGMDAAMTHAVVSYRVTVGPGPYPGCAWFEHVTALFRRGADGTWTRVKALAHIVT